MTFSKDLGLQLYVDNVEREKEFYQAIGFEILSVEEMMGFTYVTMKTCSESTVLFTIYEKEFIRQVSPEVIDMVPSILFETDDIHGLRARVAAETDNCSEVTMDPFPNFNFGTPGGMHFAVKGN